MKSLFVVRHAKSDWNSAAQTDFDRPLNDRGNKDAPLMAKRMFDQGHKLDVLISSNAMRAKTTAQFFADVYGYKTKNIILVPELYHAPAQQFYDTIKWIDDSLQHVAIFSHNPGITHFVNSLGVAIVDDMPTCGIFGITVEASRWSDFEKAKKTFLYFDYPKMG
jgi:phosphohistidine phosphatase